MTYKDWLTTPINTPCPPINESTWAGWLRETYSAGESIGFRVGALLAYGEDAFPQTYVTYAEMIGCSKQTLYNAASLARAYFDWPEGIDVRRRFKKTGELEEWKLTLGHWEALANRALTTDERISLAAEVKDRQLSRDHTRELVKQFLKAKSLPEETPKLPRAVSEITPDSEDAVGYFGQHDKAAPEPDEVDTLIAKGEALLLALPKEERDESINAFLASKHTPLAPVKPEFVKPEHEAAFDAFAPGKYDALRCPSEDDLQTAWEAAVEEGDTSVPGPAYVILDADLTEWVLAEGLNLHVWVNDSCRKRMSKILAERAKRATA
jgi:hypothetical protein